ncbi:hypothetical protein LJC22_00435 [Desulfosarcina sp. OttesenSCG-928-G10]|nr:hypothetical protein [Desulfosarcina sp. OttesenSCG-928-G10]MDL2321195.1 hypothetical protein [Desulfosarcina sp. OttesenSCG-928-B08]
MIGRLRETLYGITGRNRYTLYKQYRDMQFLPRKELLKRQFQMLSAMLRHAYETVPYYREKFEALKITPEDIRSFDDFRHFPVLTRQNIQDNLPGLLSSAVPETMRRLNSSGGTTGNPISFYTDTNVITIMEGTWLAALSFAGWTPSDMVCSIWGNPKESTDTVINAGLKQWLSGRIVLNGYHYNAADMHNWLNLFKKFRRVFLYGYVSVLTDLADYIHESGASVSHVHGVLTSAERLYPAQRKKIQAALGCGVYDQYGCREVPGIASECAKGGMHLLTHSAYTEFLPLEDAHSTALEDIKLEDTAGLRRIVVTGLHNRAMPLIRYENGDFGAPAGGDCVCGRNTPLMRMGVGRVGGSLRLLDGSRLYSSIFVHQVFNLDGISQFQFRQIAPDQVILYIVKGPRFNDTSAAKLRELQVTFPKNLCPGIQLELHYVDEVPRTPAGKHRHVVCEIEL